MQPAVIEPIGLLSQFLPSLEPNAELLEERAPRHAFHVVIMESSSSLARLLATGLRADASGVDVAATLEQVRELLSASHPNLLILDLDLPDLDGLATLESLRDEYPETAILVLSGRSGVDGLVSALDHGADEYLQKPFSLLELMARVRVLRRRSTTTAAPSPVRGGTKLSLDRDRCRVERDGRKIDLTPREFALLEYLVQNQGKTLSRAVLTQEVWNMPADANTNIVDVYIKYLRDKLDGDFEDKLIRTVRGMGYLFQV